MQNRPEALFKQIARDSEDSDRGAAVFVAKRQRNQFRVVKAQNDVCIKTVLQCGCMKINSIQNLKTK